MNAPQPFRPNMPQLWWLQRPNYLRYMLRELTCVWIGAYVVVLIVGLTRLKRGPGPWEAYMQALSSTPGIIFQILALAFALYHTVSWFALAPSTMPVWRGEEQIPPGWIKAAHYVAWGLVSIIILWAGGV